MTRAALSRRPILFSRSPLLPLIAGFFSPIRFAGCLGDRITDRSIGKAQHFSRVLPGDGGYFDAPEHAGKLFDPGIAIKRYNAAADLTVLRGFANLPLPVGTCCHLG